MAATPSHLNPDPFERISFNHIIRAQINRNYILLGRILDIERAQKEYMSYVASVAYCAARDVGSEQYFLANGGGSYEI